MAKATFGIVTALGLASFSPAWAGDQKPSDEKITRDAVASGEPRPRSARAKATVVQAGKERATAKESTEVRASQETHEERWLREREGYRDGGY